MAGRGSENPRSLFLIPGPLAVELPARQISRDRGSASKRAAGERLGRSQYNGLTFDGNRAGTSPNLRDRDCRQ
jgi:hypothetical protein